MIKPTIGRRVWYWPSQQDKGLTESPPKSIMTANLSQPCDAGICCVWGDRCVNLTVADHNGNMHSRWSVPLLQPGDLIPDGGGYATWMDYQVANAPPADYRDRVRAEEKELNERIAKLSAFMPTDAFKALPKEEQELLTAQLAAMQDYSGCLAERIALFKA